MIYPIKVLQKYLSNFVVLDLDRLVSH